MCLWDRKTSNKWGTLCSHAFSASAIHDQSKFIPGCGGNGGVATAEERSLAQAQARRVWQQ